MPYRFDYPHFAGLDLFVNGLKEKIYRRLQPIRVEAWITKEPVPFIERQSGHYRNLQIGESWGDLWDCAWMHLTGNIPSEATGQKVVLLIDFNGEGCIVDEAGMLRLGVTTVNSEFDRTLGLPGKRVIELTPLAIGGEAIDLWLEAGANDLFGKRTENGMLREAHLAVCNDLIRQLYYDAFVLHDLMLKLPESSARRAKIFAALHQVKTSLRTFSDSEVQHALTLLAVELNKTGGTPSLTISAVGHAHIDLAWLWPLRETIRKGGRTFATALAMMDRYPDYVFGASQPQLYQWVKDQYPTLYERIKARIAEGRWEVQGGMWVEPDVNISGGEALVRQLLYGKRFFQQEFGITVRMLWLPDVFGYSGALPQLMKKAGLDYFMTTKLGWNKFNAMPHHTFIWQGIDGSRVLAHLPPEQTYNSSAAPHAVIKAEQDYQDKYVSDNALLVFGIGDGGGGPGEEHLENLSRIKNLEGLSPVVQEPAEVFFQHLEQNSAQYPTWVGELYFEFHQGTLTTQARNKRYNRKLEIALRELEWTAVLAMNAAGHYADYAYPAELEAIWKEMLLYQFHDILPGSSIKRVYDESLARYQALMEQTYALLEEATTRFLRAVDTSAFQNPVVVFNSLSWSRTEWIHVDDRWLQATVPAMGYATFEGNANTPYSSDLRATADCLENDRLIVRFKVDGSIASVFDKIQRREVINPETPANRLAVYDDDGDAWDFPFDYAERLPGYFELTDAQPMIEGMQAVLQQTYEFGQSRLTQQIVLTQGSTRLDFVTQVDWRENAKMLRTGFPLTVRSNEVTCDIQFGTIKRPTHTNTSWDLARIEISAHKWVDLSEADYGVALLNDCKYGYHVEESLLDLNLLRSPHFPDDKADRAVHQFTYALYPHTGNFRQGRVVQAGYELNIPLRVTTCDVHAGSLPPCDSTLQLDVANVIVEAVKKAEDSDAAIIRLYETDGASAHTRLSFNTDLTRVELVNLVEESISVLPITSERSLELTFGVYEIQTVRIHLNSA